MLPAAARLRRREDFSLVVRRGRRAGRPTLVAHHLAPASGDSPAQAGFVVGKAVGNSVVRHRVIRRLRHLVRDRLALLPAGSMLVVRALPPAATADSAALGHDLDAALSKLGLTLSPGSAVAGAPVAGSAVAVAPVGPSVAGSAGAGPAGAGPAAGDVVPAGARAAGDEGEPAAAGAGGAP